MIYVCKPSKLAIYVNTDRKSTAEIKAETGCTALINGGLFNGAFEPVCHLKVDGRVLASDQYKYWGFGWTSGKADLQLVEDYSNLDNYICCDCMVRDGKPQEMHYDQKKRGGYRRRAAIGVYEDGRVWLYAELTGQTPEHLRDLALQEGLKHAIMLDGGLSTQGSSPAGTVAGGREVHNYICVWAQEADKSPESPTTKGEDKMFKIALGAGHGITTPGKRCDKALDPNETPEWWLNDRICDMVESYLKDYEGYEILRLDDSDDGKDDIALASRVNAANSWKADVYVSVHHNAGANRTNAGGICVFSYPGSAKGATWRDEFYDALIAKTGLKGNRAQPKLTANFYVLKHTSMPAVLLELGFMDSKIDVPIILTDDFAKKCARAIVEILVKRGDLKKKVKQPDEAAIYRVQLGAFSKKENAEKLLAQLKAEGHQAYIVRA